MKIALHLRGEADQEKQQRGVNQNQSDPFPSLAGNVHAYQ
jgi:hypothetical protein